MTIQADVIRFGQFMNEYEKQLGIAVERYPDEYPWAGRGLSGLSVKTVAQKMGAAILRESYNKDGRAFRATCKALGIQYTYIAIRAFLENAVTAQGG